MLPFGSTRAGAAGAAVGLAATGCWAAGAEVGAAGGAVAGAAVGLATAACVAGALVGALVGAGGAVGVQARSKLVSTQSLVTTDTALQRPLGRLWVGAVLASSPAIWCTVIVSPLWALFQAACRWGHGCCSGCAAPFSRTASGSQCSVSGCHDRDGPSPGQPLSNGDTVAS